MELIFRDSIHLRQPHSDLLFCLKLLCRSSRRFGANLSQLLLLAWPWNLRTFGGRARNVLASRVLPPIPTHSALLLAWILNQNLLPNQNGKKYFDSSPKIQYLKYAGVAQCECLLWSNIFIFRLDQPFFNIYSAVFIYEYLFVRSKVHNRAIWKTIQKYREGLSSLNRWCLWCNEC